MGRGEEVMRRMTCGTIYGYIDKGTDVLDVSQVGKELQHAAGCVASSGWLIRCGSLAVYQIFQPLVYST